MPDALLVTATGDPGQHLGSDTGGDHMPRLALKDYEIVLRDKKETIMIYMGRRGYDNRTMSEKMSGQVPMSYASFCRKIKDVGRFTAKELAVINIILQIPRDERV